MNDELEVTVVLPDHETELRVVRLEGREAISRPFRFDVEVVARDGAALPDDVAPGAKATIQFRRGGEEVRRVHGILTRVKSRAFVERGRAGLQLRLAPRAMRADLITTQEVYLDQSVPEIIIGKLDLVKAGGVAPDHVPHYGLDASRYRKRELVVQYKETDLAFISRLAEDAGISFYFEHDGRSDRICLADATSGFRNGAQVPAIRLTHHEGEPDGVHAFERTESMRPGSYVVYDYNYRRASEVIWPRRDTRPEPGTPPGSTFEYGCHAKDEDEARAIHAVRLDEIRCRRVRYTGRSSIVGMAAGGQTKVEAPDPALDGTRILVTSVRHSVTPRVEGEETLIYRNTFRAVGVEHTYRPKRRTPKPRIDGVVTGVVHGPGGSTTGDVAHIDDEARYLVQFHFDWAAEPGQRASRWLRMAQPFGGRGTDGMQFPLKPGTEVVIGFVDGDPDRPLILGAIPNVHARSPVDAKTATLHRVTTADGIVVQFGKR